MQHNAKDRITLQIQTRNSLEPQLLSRYSILIILRYAHDGLYVH